MGTGNFRDDFKRGAVTQIAERSYPHTGGLRLSRGSHRPLFSPRDQLADAEPPSDRRRPAGLAHGGLAAQAERRGADPLRSRAPIHQHGLSGLPAGSQS